ncbi:MAG: flagellar basal-body rod protein FlgG [Halobacteriovoraceae bacterium]|nr:flagellar basal-body rod protein FlgG [Halobacteriovoraceae bacterium]
MIRALNTAATGMKSQDENVNNISNNIANVNTVGFKKSRTEFEDLYYETIDEPGAATSDNTIRNVGIQVGSGSKVSATRKEFTQGSPQITNNPFDLMLNGEGFFGIIMPNGEVRYTRDGAFNVDNTGKIVTKDGHAIFPAIQLPPNTKSVSVSEKGDVDAFVSGETEPVGLGQIPVFTFTNPVGLKSAGKNLFLKTASSGEAFQNVAGENSSGFIQQGALELSNVSIMNEMTNLIKAQRAYEMNSKVMTVADQMLQTVNNIR